LDQVALGEGMLKGKEKKRIPGWDEERKDA
jgi:hypothetical protein